MHQLKCVHAEMCRFVIKRDDGEEAKNKLIGIGSSSGTLPIDGDSAILSWTNISHKALVVSFFCQVFTRDKFDGSMESLQSAISSESTSKNSVLLFNTSTQSFSSK